MTLSILPYLPDPETGEARGFPFPDGGDALGGFEACRRELWGSRIAQELGLELLPTLARDDLYVPHDRLDALEREARTLLDHLAAVSRATRYDEEFIEHRTGNILKAIARAREHPGAGVMIF